MSSIVPVLIPPVFRLAARVAAKRFLPAPGPATTAGLRYCARPAFALERLREIDPEHMFHERIKPGPWGENSTQRCGHPPSAEARNPTRR